MVPKWTLQNPYSIRLYALQSVKPTLNSIIIFKKYIKSLNFRAPHTTQSSIFQPIYSPKSSLTKEHRELILENEHIHDHQILQTLNGL